MVNIKQKSSKIPLPFYDDLVKDYYDSYVNRRKREYRLKAKYGTNKENENKLYYYFPQQETMLYSKPMREVVVTADKPKGTRLLSDELKHLNNYQKSQLNRSTYTDPKTGAYTQAGVHYIHDMAKYNRGNSRKDDYFNILNKRKEYEDAYSKYIKTKEIVDNPSSTLDESVQVIGPYFEAYNDANNKGNSYKQALNTNDAIMSQLYPLDKLALKALIKVKGYNGAQQALKSFISHKSNKGYEGKISNYFLNRLAYPDIASGGGTDLYSLNNNVKVINKDDKNGVVLINDYIENNGLASTQPAKKYKSNSFFIGDENINSDNFTHFIGVENGHLKYGTRNDFNDSTLITPIRTLKKDAPKITKFIQSSNRPELSDTYFFQNKEYDKLEADRDNIEKEIEDKEAQKLGYKNYKELKKLDSDSIRISDPDLYYNAIKAGRKIRNKVFENQKFRDAEKRLYDYYDRATNLSDSLELIYPKLFSGSTDISLQLEDGSTIPYMQYPGIQQGKMFLSGGKGGYFIGDLSDLNADQIDSLNAYLQNNPSYPIQLDLGGYSDWQKPNSKYTGYDRYFGENQNNYAIGLKYKKGGSGLKAPTWLELYKHRNDSNYYYDSYVNRRKRYGGYIASRYKYIYGGDDKEPVAFPKVYFPDYARQRELAKSQQRSAEWQSNNRKAVKVAIAKANEDNRKKAIEEDRKKWERIQPEKIDQDAVNWNNSTSGPLLWAALAGAKAVPLMRSGAKAVVPKAFEAMGRPASTMLKAYPKATPYAEAFDKALWGGMGTFGVGNAAYNWGKGNISTGEAIPEIALNGLMMNELRPAMRYYADAAKTATNWRFTVPKDANRYYRKVGTAGDPIGDAIKSGVIRAGGANPDLLIPIETDEMIDLDNILFKLHDYPMFAKGKPWRGADARTVEDANKKPIIIRSKKDTGPIVWEESNKDFRHKGHAGIFRPRYYDDLNASPTQFFEWWEPKRIGYLRHDFPKSNDPYTNFMGNGHDTKAYSLGPKGNKEYPRQAYYWDESDKQYDLDLFRSDYNEGLNAAKEYLGSDFRKMVDERNERAARMFGYGDIGHIEDRTKNLQLPFLKYNTIADRYADLAKVTRRTDPALDEITFNLMHPQKNEVFHELIHRADIGASTTHRGLSFTQRNNREDFGFDIIKRLLKPLTDEEFYAMGKEDRILYDYLKGLNINIETQDQLEAVANFLEIGKELGIKYGAKYPGKEKVLKILEDAEGNPNVGETRRKMIKFLNKDNTKYIWRALTGGLLSTIPFLNNENNQNR